MRKCITRQWQMKRRIESRRKNKKYLLTKQNKQTNKKWNHVHAAWIRSVPCREGRNFRWECSLSKCSSSPGFGLNKSKLLLQVTHHLLISFSRCAVYGDTYVRDRFSCGWLSQATLFPPRLNEYHIVSRHLRQCSFSLHFHFHPPLALSEIEFFPTAH